MAKSLIPFFEELKKQYGQPSGQWALWCKRPKNWAEREQVAIEAILTQRANWLNVQQAVENLEKAGCLLLRDIVEMSPGQLERLIRPSGFYRQKSVRLLTLAKVIEKDSGGLKRLKSLPVGKVRQQLLSISGIGPETADDILLYALDKAVFVVDEYTRRWAKLFGFPGESSYSKLQEFFQERLPQDYRVYQDFHALIVIDGKARRGKKCLSEA
ncbi:MAG: hypothetical protein NC911_09050 [Candidatus Omnitrophica bacterium]|nr:hypothetical protein [Candidatus Omnitrophota bacterium]